MYTTTVEEDPLTGDLYITLDDTVMEELGWEIGDELIWEGNHQTVYVRKKDAPTVGET